MSLAPIRIGRGARRATIRAIALLAVVLLGAGWLAGLLDSTHPHTICLEHGDVVHGSPDGHGRDDSPNAYPQSLVGGEAAAGKSDSAHPDPKHKHCTTALAALKQTALRPSPSELTPWTASVPATAYFTEAAWIPAAAVYTLAPKHSPPQA
jgi:hypothetical protein